MEINVNINYNYLIKIGVRYYEDMWPIIAMKHVPSWKYINHVTNRQEQWSMSPKWLKSKDCRLICPPKQGTVKDILRYKTYQCNKTWHSKEHKKHKMINAKKNVTLRDMQRHEKGMKNYSVHVMTWKWYMQ